MDNNNPIKPPESPVEKPEEKPPEYSYDDVHKEPIEDIAENKVVPEVSGAEIIEEVKAKDETKVKEEADVKAKLEAEAKEEAVAVKPEELAEDISKRITDKLSPKEEAKDKYDEFFNQVKLEKGREPNWIELSQFLEDQAIVRLEQKIKQADEEKAKQDADKAKASEEFTKRFNSQIDEELDELYKSKKLSPIKDKDNPTDQGVIERKALFQAMLDTNAKRTSEGKDTILSISRIFNNYYKKPTAQPAGSEAPVSMGKGTPAGEGEQEIDYIKDVKKPWSLFRRTK